MPVPLLAPLLGSLAATLLPASATAGITGGVASLLGGGALAAKVAAAAPAALGSAVGTLAAGGDLAEAAKNAVLGGVGGAALGGLGSLGAKAGQAAAQTAGQAGAQAAAQTAAAVTPQMPAQAIADAAAASSAPAAASTVASTVAPPAIDLADIKRVASLANAFGGQGEPRNVVNSTPPLRPQQEKQRLSMPGGVPALGAGLEMPSAGAASAQQFSSATGLPILPIGSIQSAGFPSPVETTVPIQPVGPLPSPVQQTSMTPRRRDLAYRTGFAAGGPVMTDQERMILARMGVGNRPMFQGMGV